ncbi:putative RNA-directed DNA polymerase, eukaryota, reverse transcriptase zinc-binding domain protein [Tanacetum coccineum]
MIQGITKDGVWILDPSQIKEVFLNFFKDMFKDHDSNVDFLPFGNAYGLCSLDRESLEIPVNFEKAFDSVSWKYLDFVLLNLGFGTKWRSWIRACLSSSRASVLVNGSPTSKFSIKRGLGQGDPFSPFLFILVMKGLHCALFNAVSSGLIRGFLLSFGSKNNIQKSNIYGIGVSDDDVSSMASNLDVLLDPFLLRILGYLLVLI